MLRKLHFSTRQGTTEDTFDLGTLFTLGRGYSCCFCCGKSLVLCDSSRVVVVTYFAITFMVLLFRALASKQK